MIKSLTCPNVFQNINPTNNVLTFTVSGTPFTATIPAGFYSIDTLATAIAAQMSAVTSEVITATVNLISMTITLTFPSGDYVLVYATSTIADIIGLGADTTAASSWLSGFINLSGLTNLSVECVNFVSEKTTHRTNLLMNTNEIKMIPTTTSQLLEYVTFLPALDSDVFPLPVGSAIVQMQFRLMDPTVNPRVNVDAYVPTSQNFYWSIEIETLCSHDS